MKTKESLHTKIKYNHIRLDKAKSKLIKLQEIKESANVHLCFGSNKLFKQQFQINSNNNQSKFKSKQDWDNEWFYQRHKEVTLIGSKDESAGNANAQITHIKDNLFSLRLNINHKAKKVDKYLNIQFKVDYEKETLINIMIK